MDAAEKERLKKIYKEEMPEEELAEMALVDPREYEAGVYDLVTDAVRKRGLAEAIEEMRRGDRLSLKEEKWVKICDFNTEAEKETLRALFADKDIPVDIISHERLAYGGSFQQSTGMGSIRVKANQTETAKKVLADFQKFEEDDNADVANDIIAAAVRRVLKQHGINDVDKITAEIMTEIERQG